MVAAREVELKGIVPDLRAARQRLEAAGARLTFEGRLEDRRYEDPWRRLVPDDIVLRLRTYRAPGGGVQHAELDWKGPTRYEAGYKVRDELATDVGDPDTLDGMLHRLGYTVVREIDREIAQYELAGAVVRFERYPRMDTLAEVEGAPEAIERAIAHVGLPRSTFSSARLPQFVAEYESRTGTRAALCDRELAGEFPYRTADA
jgi:adenylate cyclase class IV